MAERIAPAERHFLSFIGLLVLIVSLCAGCAGSSPGRYEIGAAELPHRSPARPVRKIARQPWENWTPRRDLNGAKLRQPGILKGDDHYLAGRPELAVEEYVRAAGGQLTSVEREAVILRLAGTQLVLDQPARALETLSHHFRTQHAGVDNVDAPFSLLFGYAYGRNRDTDQSLAWFSRVVRLGGRGPLGDSAEQGGRFFISAIDPARFDAAALGWQGDPFVHRLFGEERARRAAGGQVAAFSGPGSFWSGEAVNPGVPEIVEPGSVKVGVLLPLSGRFGALGTSTRNGLDLALAGYVEQGLVQIIYRDSSDDPGLAMSGAEELVHTERAAIVVGPLLSEHVLPVSDLVRRAGSAMVTFSKRSDVTTGGGVFRLGTTVESQVDSLIDAAYGKLNLRRFGLVYPQDPAGDEFATAFRERLAAVGAAPIFERSYPRDDLNALTSMSAELEAFQVDGIFVPDNVTSAARFFTSLAPAQRARVTPLGIATWDNPNELENSRAALAGAVYVSLFFTQSPRPEIATFLQSYEGRYQQRPDFLAAQGFDAGTLIAAAIDRIPPGGGSMTSALDGLQAYQGLTGSILLDGSGELRRTFAVVQLQEGGLSEVTAAPVPLFTNESIPGAAPVGSEGLTEPARAAVTPVQSSGMEQAGQL